MRTDYTVGQNPPNSNTQALQSKLCILKSDTPRYGAPESLYDVLSDDNSQRFRLSQTFRIILASVLQHLFCIFAALAGFTTVSVARMSWSSEAAIEGPLQQFPSLLKNLTSWPMHGHARLSSNVSGIEPVDNDPVNAQY